MPNYFMPPNYGWEVRYNRSIIIIIVIIIIIFLKKLKDLHHNNNIINIIKIA